MMKLVRMLSVIYSHLVRKTVCIVSFSVIFTLVETADSIQLTRDQRVALQGELNAILERNPPVNIPEGGRWDNHYCGVDGSYLDRGPDGNHRNVLKLIIEVPQGGTIAAACQEKMRNLIRIAANRLPNNADVTLQNGEYTITPLDNNRQVTTFRFQCYVPGTGNNNSVRGPHALVLQLNAERNGFAHVYPR